MEETGVTKDTSRLEEVQMTTVEKAKTQLLFQNALIAQTRDSMSTEF
jgi:hypothetical protein